MDGWMGEREPESSEKELVNHTRWPCGIRSKPKAMRMAIMTRLQGSTQ